MDDSLLSQRGFWLSHPDAFPRRPPMKQRHFSMQRFPAGRLVHAGETRSAAPARSSAMRFPQDGGVRDLPVHGLDSAGVRVSMRSTGASRGGGRRRRSVELDSLAGRDFLRRGPGCLGYRLAWTAAGTGWCSAASSAGRQPPALQRHRRALPPVPARSYFRGHADPSLLLVIVLRVAVAGPAGSARLWFGIGSARRPCIGWRWCSRCPVR